MTPEVCRLDLLERDLQVAQKVLERLKQVTKIARKVQPVQNASPKLLNTSFLQRNKEKADGVNGWDGKTKQEL
jgi:predicted transcriptional regulator